MEPPAYPMSNEEMLNRSVKREQPQHYENRDEMYMDVNKLKSNINKRNIKFYSDRMSMMG